MHLVKAFVIFSAWVAQGVAEDMKCVLGDGKCQNPDTTSLMQVHLSSVSGAGRTNAQDVGNDDMDKVVEKHGYGKLDRAGAAERANAQVVGNGHMDKAVEKNGQSKEEGAQEGADEDEDEAIGGCGNFKCKRRGRAAALAGIDPNDCGAFSPMLPLVDPEPGYPVPWVPDQITTVRHGDERTCVETYTTANPNINYNMRCTRTRARKAGFAGVFQDRHTHKEVCESCDCDGV